MYLLLYLIIHLIIHLFICLSSAMWHQTSRNLHCQLRNKLKRLYNYVCVSAHGNITQSTISKYLYVI